MGLPGDGIGAAERLIVPDGVGHGAALLAQLHEQICLIGVGYDDLVFDARDRFIRGNVELTGTGAVGSDGDTGGIRLDQHLLLGLGCALFMQGQDERHHHNRRTAGDQPGSPLFLFFQHRQRFPQLFFHHGMFGFQGGFLAGFPDRA